MKELTTKKEQATDVYRVLASDMKNRLIGLFDDNGVEIREGDTLRVGTMCYDGERFSNAKVVWDTCQYKLSGCGWNFQHCSSKVLNN